LSKKGQGPFFKKGTVPKKGARPLFILFMSWRAGLGAHLMLNRQREKLEAFPLSTGVIPNFRNVKC